MSQFIGRIYRLIGNNHFYYGSTVNTLQERFYQHQSNLFGSKQLVHLFYNSIGWENVSIELISETIYTSRTELLHDENSYIMNYYNDPLCLNTKLAIKCHTFVPTIDKTLLPTETMALFITYIKSLD